MKHFAEQFEFDFNEKSEDKSLFSRHDHTAALELIDGAYEIVELWKPTGEYNEKWRKEWLRKARELGAQPLL